MRWIAILALAVAILLASAVWLGEQRYKDCLYETIGATQADNTAASASSGFEQVGPIRCSRSPF
jgi:hypothetical protein